MHPKPSQDQPRVHLPSGIAVSEITGQTARILRSPAFQKSKRLSRFLSFAVENALAGMEEALKESVLGLEVFDRGPNFDSRLDPIVRIDARRLRARLAEYYLGAGAGDPVLIEFETGSYVPRFRVAQAVEPEPQPRLVHAPKPIRQVLTLDLLRRARRELEDLPTVAGMMKAHKLFERAAATNPDNPLAHLGVALASIWMPVLGCESAHTSLLRARQAVQRVLDLDSTNAEAHTILGMVSALYDHDFRAANASFLLSMRLKTDFTLGQQLRATAYLAPMGYLAEAADTVVSVLQRDPRARFRFSLGWIRYLQRDFTAAIEDLEATLRVNPQFIQAIYILLQAYERVGRFDAAAATLANEGLRTAYPLVANRCAALAFLRDGKREEALATARRMETQYSAGASDPLLIAEVYAALEDPDAAFDWLNRAYEDRRYWLVNLKSDPAFDVLHADPRFAELVARMGLPASA